MSHLTLFLDWWKEEFRKGNYKLFLIFLLEFKLIFRVSAIKNGTHIPSEEGEDFVDAFLIKMEKDKNEGIQSTFELVLIFLALVSLQDIIF